MHSCRIFPLNGNGGIVLRYFANYKATAETMSAGMAGVVNFTLVYI